MTTMTSLKQNDVGNCSIPRPLGKMTTMTSLECELRSVNDWEVPEGADDVRDSRNVDDVRESWCW